MPSYEIPNPCHEDWQKMTPTDQGRHCAVCQKCVVDLTRTSTREIKHLLDRKDSELCIRIGQDQLASVNQLEREQARWNRCMVAATAALFAVTGSAFGQSEMLPIPSQQETIHIHQDTAQSSAPNKSDFLKQKDGKAASVKHILNGEKVLIKGKVTHLGTHEGIPGSTIRLTAEGFESAKHTVSDVNGEFQFWLEERALKEVKIVVSHSGYDREIFQNSAIVPDANGTYKLPTITLKESSTNDEALGMAGKVSSEEKQQGKRRGIRRLFTPRKKRKHLYQTMGIYKNGDL
ncbi:MAG: hypothetical protein AAF135_02900 [Bacteroidota bacterium]